MILKLITDILQALEDPSIYGIKFKDKVLKRCLKFLKELERKEDI